MIIGADPGRNESNDFAVLLASITPGERLRLKALARWMIEQPAEFPAAQSWADNTPDGTREAPEAGAVAATNGS